MGNAGNCIVSKNLVFVGSGQVFAAGSLGFQVLSERRTKFRFKMHSTSKVSVILK